MTEQEAAEAGRPAAQEMLILAVDDIKANLIALERTLSGVPARVIRASSGEEALAACVKHRFALAILDVQMPTMDGYELAEILLSDPTTAYTPIIFVSAAYSDETHLFKGYGAGAVDYIVKPYTPAILLAKVRVFLELARHRMDLESVVEERTRALRLSEQRYRTLFETMAQGVLYHDASGQISEANPAAVRILGLPRDMLVGQHPKEAMSPARREDGSMFPVEEHPALVALRTGRQVANGVMGLRRGHDGADVWININAIPQFKPREATPFQVFTTFSDITARRLAEQAVADSERALRAVFEGTQDGILAFDGETRRILLANDAMFRLLGWARGQVPAGVSADDLLRPADLTVMLERYRAGTPGVQQILDMPVKRRDGGAAIVDASITQLDLGGQRCLLGIFRDMTERRRAEFERSAELERRVVERTVELTELYDNAPCGYHTLDASGRFLRVNATELRWLGYTREDLFSQKTFWDLVVPEDREALQKSFVVLADLGEVNGVELQVERNDGSRMPVVFNAVAVRDAEGQFIQAHVTVFDDTERHRAREALRLANTALFQANRSKDEFLAGMSHELRTPLSTILGISELLLDDIHGPLNEGQATSVRRIEESGRHLLSLINDVLDLAKIGAGKLGLDVGPLRVNDLCRASLRLVQEAAIRKHIHTAFSVKDEGAVLVADERRLKQVLVNLLSNAVKFTPEGGHVGLIAETDETAGTLRMVVWDTGIGIASESLGRLFQPFVQLDSSLSRQHAGTGLGLSLVRQIMELHGGNVSVESMLGKGSRFTVTMPLQRATPSLPGLSVPGGRRFAPAQAPGRDPSVMKQRILLAEDDEANSQIVNTFLTARGFEVIIARNGQQAMELVQQVRPKLVLMDVQMPGTDGFAAMQSIRAHPDPAIRDVPIVALTALAMGGDRERCLEAGASEYLPKPVTMKTLLATIETLLPSP